MSNHNPAQAVREALARITPPYMCASESQHELMERLRTNVEAKRTIIDTAPALLAALDEARDRLAVYESHGPEGRNVTNLQFQQERAAREQAERERDTLSEKLARLRAWVRSMLLKMLDRSQSDPTGITGGIARAYQAVLDGMDALDAEGEKGGGA